MANNHSETERRLWEAADEFRANSDLKSSEYATPVKELSKEDQRGVAEQLSEEELALFDILTKPEIDMTAKEKK